ncbi:MAG: DUF4248 domain-containing protein [Bacteroidaceae bacterium]|nr:DUF4248 domain-containing protein [Bacteroidaceae bacterium]
MKCSFTSKTDLARSYFPNHSDSGARRLLMDTIASTPPLISMLHELGYSKEQHFFTPRQVEMVIEYLGNPFK